jgi:hypothetical protein
MISHTAKLPGGFTAEFHWTTGMQVEWTPDVPGPGAFRSPHLQAKFVRAYTTERDTFLQMVALDSGTTIAVADVDVRSQDVTITRMTITRPPTRQ